MKKKPVMYRVFKKVYRIFPIFNYYDCEFCGNSFKWEFGWDFPVIEQGIRGDDYFGFACKKCCPTKDDVYKKVELANIKIPKVTLIKYKKIERSNNGL